MADEDGLFTITWLPVEGATGWSVYQTRPEGDPVPPPLPSGFRQLERGLRRLEDIVLAWQRAIESAVAPPISYRVTAFDAAGDEIVPTPVPPAEG